MRLANEWNSKAQQLTQLFWDPIVLFSIWLINYVVRTTPVPDLIYPDIKLGVIGTKLNFQIRTEVNYAACYFLPSNLNWLIQLALQQNVTQGCRHQKPLCFLFFLAGSLILTKNEVEGGTWKTWNHILTIPASFYWPVQFSLKRTDVVIYIGRMLLYISGLSRCTSIE
jgi:hypothetical protein